MVETADAATRGAETATLAAQGFRMPAEWEPHKATWIAWPHNLKDWPGKFAPIPWVYAEFVRILSRFERVNILLNAKTDRRARNLYRAIGDLGVNLAFHYCATDRSWVRDTGPIFVRNDSGNRRATLWKFNAWAKYRNYERDLEVAKVIALKTKNPVHAVSWRGRLVVLEGGAIDVDGAGLLMATEECLLSKEQERNPGMSRTDIEQVLKGNLGVNRIIWLNKGIVGDDTHGHIDDVARFVAPNRVVIAQEQNEQDPNFPILQENFERLQSEKLDIITIPMPSPIVFDGQRLPASYLNFYIANGVVLVPTFNDPMDRIALSVIAALFRDREVIGINCTDLVWGLGTLHCMTMQEPA